MSHDAARPILETVLQTWQINWEAVESSAHGFDWWPGHHRVRVRCRPGGKDSWRLSVQTDLLRKLDLSRPDARMFMAQQSTFSPTYAWVCKPAGSAALEDFEEDGAVWFYSAVSVHPDTAAWLPRYFASLAILQPVQAQRAAHELARMGGGEACPSGPHQGKETAELDQMLGVEAQVYAPRGREPSRWSGSPEFASIAEQFGRNDRSLGQGDPRGLALETPFRDDTALIRLLPDIRHPSLGSGLHGSLMLPAQGDAEACIATCFRLNYAGAAPGVEIPVLGSWHPRETKPGQFSASYGVMIPNALYAEAAATQLALWLLDIAAWARLTLHPDASDSTMRAIVESRLAGMR
jgi:hypothetical protein